MKRFVQPWSVDDVEIAQDGHNAPAAAVEEQTNSAVAVDQVVEVDRFDERKDQNVDQGGNNCYNQIGEKDCIHWMGDFNSKVH